MFTAEMVKQRLKDTEGCPGIDEWIENSLLPKFKLNDSVNVSDALFDPEGYRWSRGDFVMSMKLRGFIMEFYCEGAPYNGITYYKVTLPEDE